MKALRIHAGAKALAHLRRHGLQPQDVCTIPAAAGGPKGLVLGPLDRFLFGTWLPRSTQPVHLVGASIGAWRMATACLPDPVAALQRLEHDYIAQQYDPEPGARRPTPQQVSARFGQTLQAFYGGQIDSVLQHPRYRLHIVAAHGRHLLGREHRWATPLGYLGAFVSNMGQGKAPGAACAPLPFATHDLRTRQLPMTEANFLAAMQAICSIPFVLQAVPHIAGAPSGAYWDGGITDYHMHLHYRCPQNAIETIAASAMNTRTEKQKKKSPNGQVLYPH